MKYNFFTIIIKKNINEFLMKLISRPTKFSKEFTNDGLENLHNLVSQT